MAKVNIRGRIYKKRGEKKKWQGNYAKYRGKRSFRLVPVEGKGKPMPFPSAKAAVKAGYQVVSK